MKTTRYILMSVAMAALTLTSCSESFLDKLPDERIEIDNEEKVSQLLISCYPSGSYAWICEISSDNMMDNNAPHLPASPNAEQVLTHYNLSSYDRVDDEMFSFEPAKSSTNQDTPGFLWETFYGAIASVNHALEAIDEISDHGQNMTPSLTASRAEALLIRAYCHFILVNVFSQAYKTDELSRADKGIPYMTSPEENVLVEYDRGTVTDTYAKIQADLEEGLANLSERNYKMPKWRFNLNAAHAFAARFYLYKRDWNKVIEHANFVLGTDNESILSKLMDFSHFDECTYGSDYAKVWQDPASPNNLMLIDTHSLMFRRGLGNRYAQNGQVVKDLFYHNSPMWNRWIVNPTAYVSGMTFWTGEDYGYCSSKVYEEFEYTDKIAGIGYVHTIKREFTCNELLLERAEAYIMQGNYASALEDLINYEKSNQSFSPQNLISWGANGGMADLTVDIINSYYAKASNPNCLENWDFLTNMSPSAVVPAEGVPYMNCLNDFRRFETNWDGLRFFDLKRWGMEYSHFIGADNIEYKLTWNDERRAVEVPQDAIAAGMEPSRTYAPSYDDSQRASIEPQSKFIYIK